MRLLSLLVLATGCDTGSRANPWLSDPEALGLLEALCDAELYEAAPAQSGAATAAVVVLASLFVDDETAAKYRLQQLGILPASSPASVEELDAGRAEQLELSQLDGPAVDAYFHEHQAAAHRARLSLVRDQVVTRCMDAGLCDAARDYLAVEADHLQRLTHP